MISIRNVIKKYPHPNNENFCILVLDDGYPLILPSLDNISPGSMIQVSGPIIDVNGITSYGDFAQPVTETCCSCPRLLKHSLSAGFSGLEHSQMAGLPASTLLTTFDETEIDATRIEINDPEDKWVAFFNSGSVVVCYDKSGNLVSHIPGEYPIWSKFINLGSYYTFCGVLHRPIDGSASSFVIHCIWNRVLCEPVGPPIDRKIAAFINVPFSPKIEIPKVIGDRTIMVRVDNHTPCLL